MLAVFGGYCSPLCSLGNIFDPSSQNAQPKHSHSFLDAHVRNHLALAAKRGMFALPTSIRESREDFLPRIRHY